MEIPLSGSGIPNDVNDKNNIISLNIAPNPVSETATLKYNLVENSNIKISIVDINGNVIEEVLNTTKTIGNYSTAINTSNYASGYYIINVNINGKNHSLSMNVVK